MRDDLAYPHIGIAIHFIMIKHTRHERFGAILGPLPVACARRVRPRTTSTPTPPPARPWLVLGESHVRARTRKKSMESYERATQHTIGRLHLLHRTESHKTVPGMASLSFFSRGFEKGTSLSSLLNLLTNFPEGRNGVQSIQFTIQRTFTNRLSKL